MQNRRVEIIDMNWLLDGSHAVFIGRSVDIAALDARAGEPGTKRPVVVLATGRICGVVERSTTELAGPDDQHIVEHAPLLQIAEQSRDRLVDLRSEPPVIGHVASLSKQGLAGRVPLIGFAGAPWTIFCYMTEGQGSKTFSMARRSLFADPAFAHDLLGRITDTTIAYLRLQVAAGADLVQVFDSWAGVMDRTTYRTFANPYLKRVLGR